MDKIGQYTNTADGNDEFTEGNPSGGVPATEVTEGWLNGVQRELIKIMQQMGVSPATESDDLVWKAIQKIYGKTYAGDPNGNVAADVVRERCWDTSQTPARLYIATAADGTAGGTTWTLAHKLVGAYSEVESADLLRGHINGLEIANNATDAEHDIDVATGTVTVDDGAGGYRLVKLGSSITKMMDAAFAEGDAAGGFASGESLPISGTIHIWLIAKDDGTTDVMANDHAASGLSPTLPSGFTRKRRIGSRITDGSANLIEAHQFGDLVRIQNIQDLNRTANNGSGTVALSIPNGLVLRPILTVYYRHTSSESTRTLTVTGSDGQGLIAVKAKPGGEDGTSVLDSVPSSTDGEVSFGATDDVGAITFWTNGWHDDRGRNA